MKKLLLVIGNVSINLNKVIGNSVYIGVTKTKNGQSYQKVDINNLYIDRQKLICNDEYYLVLLELKLYAKLKNQYLMISQWL